MKIYVAGPMRGYPQSNFPAFDAERDRLVARGHEVISPADIDRAEGFDPTEAGGDTFTPPGMTFEACMRRDIEVLLAVDAIAFLPGWENSVGANIEHTVGEAIGLRLYYPGDSVPFVVEPVVA